MGWRRTPFVLLLATLLVLPVAVPGPGRAEMGEAELAATALELVPAVPAPGDAVDLTVHVANQGGANASDVEVAFYADSTQIDTRTVSVPANGSGTVTGGPWNASPGNHTLRAVVDPQDTFNETNDDNTVERTIEVGPDLLAVSVAASPSDPQAGDDVTFTATVRNRGPSGTGTSFQVRFLVDGNATGNDVDTGPLASGASTQVTSAPWQAQAGTHEVHVVVDPGDALAESSESNNGAQATFDVAEAPPPPSGSPDLVVVALSWTPTSPKDGDGVRFKATVKNQGDAQASTFGLRFELDGSTPVGTRTLDPLGPGEMRDVTSELWTAKAGAHTIRADVDTDNAVDESDETNNARHVSLTVAQGSTPPSGGGSGQPDLLVLDLTWDPVDPGLGEPVQFRATVKNQGNADAGAFGVHFLLDGTSFLGLRNANGLDAGGTIVLASDPWNATAGEHHIDVTVDPTESVTEPDEANNALRRTLTLDAPQKNAAAPPTRPDLTVKNLTWSGELGPDEPIVFQVVVVNAGAAPSGPFVLRFSLDGEAFGQVSVDDLEPSVSKTLESAPWTAKPGVHTVGARVDPLDTVVESNEENNLARAELTVDETLGSHAVSINDTPELAVDKLRWEPERPTAGADVRFHARLVNRGAAVDEPFVVRFVIDGETVVDEKRIEGMPAGSSTNLTAGPWPAAEGRHAIEVFADAGAAVDEPDESNNRASATVVVAALPQQRPGLPGLGLVVVLAVLAGAITLGTALFKREA